MLTPTKVIFLDIDGVLVNRAALEGCQTTSGPCRFDPVCVENLNAITDATGAALILTSTWRRFLDNLPDILALNGVKAPMAGQTPDLSRQLPSRLSIAVERGQEIQAWLDDNPGIESFIILDDDADMGALLPRLVRTDPLAGLRVVDFVRALHLLNGR